MTDTDRHSTRLRTEAGGAVPGRHSTRLRDRAGNQQGTVVVIVAILLTVCLGAGALAIDLSSARGSEQKAQSAADAAALAVSDAASSGTTILSQLQTVGQQMADANDPGQTVQVTAAAPAGTYRVSVAGNSSGPFATGIGSHDPRVAATALAAVKQTVTSGISTSLSPTTLTSTVTNTSTSYTYAVSNTYTPCTAQGSNCLAIYAAGTDCSGDGFNGVAGSDVVDGSVISSSSFQAGGGANSFAGPLWYSGSSGCTWASNGGSNSFGGGTPQTRTPVSGWPIDYSVDFPSCSGSSCKGPSNTPRFCSQSSTATTWNLSVSAKNIYCAVGSGTPSQPSTWNGHIVIQNGNDSDTFVGGSVSVQGGGINLTSPCGSPASSPMAAWSASNCASNIPAPATTTYPMFYMTGTGTAIDLGGGSANFDGDSFAPNGNVTVSAGSVNCHFIEAQYVTIAAGSDVVSGTGPVVNAAQSTSTSTSLSSSSSTATSVSTSTSTATTTNTVTNTGSSSLVG
jgi:Flp pilus assembly protein TadG